MKNNKNFKTIILILLIIIAILAVGSIAYYAGKNNSIPQPVPAIQNQQAENKVNQNSADCSSSHISSIKVLSPNGGEIFTMGQTITIKWETCNAQPGQTVGLSIGQEISAGAFKPLVEFYPFLTANDGSEIVTLSGSSTNGNWPFAPGNNYKVSAILNPFPGNTGVTAFMQDQSDNSFTIQANNNVACNVGYNKTAESKVVSEQSPALITAFEKKCDGNYYLTFDYLGPGQGFPESGNPGSSYYTNTNLKLRTFKVDPNLKVKLINNTEVPIVEYITSLKKVNGITFNQSNAYYGISGQAVFQITVKNGILVSLNETYLP